MQVRWPFTPPFRAALPGVVACNIDNIDNGVCRAPDPAHQRVSATTVTYGQPYLKD